MKVVSKKIRNSARGQDCALRIPGVCNFNPETTVLAHVGVIAACRSNATTPWPSMRAAHVTTQLMDVQACSMQGPNPNTYSMHWKKHKPSY